jgi:adenosylhomocysteine nucleosidase
MKLVGKITNDRPLLVFSVAEEASYLDTNLPILITGIGKVNAATALAVVLARGPLPASIVNLGTAGALHPGWTGTHAIGTVIQHDFDARIATSLRGEVYASPIVLPDRDGPVLATGDLFISDEVKRRQLASYATLVDMEGYALAKAAQVAGVPLRIVKHVSDQADEGALRVWNEKVADCSRALASWASVNIPSYASAVIPAGHEALVEDLSRPKTRFGT